MEHGKHKSKNRRRDKGAPAWLYSRKIGDRICTLLSEGKSYREIQRTTDDPVVSLFPSRETLNRWLVECPSFCAQYLQSKSLGISHLVDETLEIAKDGTGDTWVDEKGQVRQNNDVVARSRLRVDTIKWYASKLAPKLYGDKVSLEHTTPPGQPVVVRHEVDNQSLADIANVISELTDADG